MASNIFSKGSQQSASSALRLIYRDAPTADVQDMQERIRGSGSDFDDFDVNVGDYGYDSDDDDDDDDLISIDIAAISTTEAKRRR